MIICPFCDSHNVEKITINEKFPVPFVGQVDVPHETYRCNDCEEEGDFDQTLDRSLKKAIDKAHFRTAKNLMDTLTERGITMTYLEKALRLPFRTTSRWRRGHISHSSLALLRIIRFSPALLQAADDNFSPAAQTKYQISRTWDYFETNTSNPVFTLTDNNGTLSANYRGNVATSAVPCTPRFLRIEKTT